MTRFDEARFVRHKRILQQNGIDPLTGGYLILGRIGSLTEVFLCRVTTRFKSNYSPVTNNLTHLAIAFCVQLNCKPGHFIL
jgi:hypothetical protein